MKVVCSLIFVGVLMLGCQPSGPPAGAIAPRTMTDALYAVIAADRLVYTREVVNRLQDAGIIRATERFHDDRTLPLPAQMLRMGAEAARKTSDSGFTYALLSPWPLNKQNAPRTALEKQGLEKVTSGHPSFYGEETLGGKKYFTAVYADHAVVEACVKCHNENADSPRRDFKVGDVMGGIVIRVPVGS